MDTKNVIAAISLSAAVIIIYALFFGPSPEQIKKAQEQKNQITQNSEAPTIEEKIEIKKTSRDEAMKASDRIFFENNSMKGSIKRFKRISSCHPIKFLGGGDGFDPVVKKKVK